MATNADDIGAEPDSVVRRAPFSHNPRVGARGQRTQQRILDAALRVFAEESYQNCRIDQITERAGCSRVSFYQYFSSKEDVFRHLSGQVARQLMASTDLLDPVTPDLDGWTSLRAWVARHAHIYDRYQPVFHAFEAASGRDQEIAAGSARWAERVTARIGSSLATTALPPRQLEPVIRLLQGGLTRTLDVTAILASAAPDSYSRDRIEDAVADVMHRSFFGVLDVNVHAPAPDRPPEMPFAPAMRRLLAEDDARLDSSAAGRGALAALLASGGEVFVRRGYRATRVDDLAAAAGVSHGAFYRYFQNKDELARLLTVQAIRSVGRTLAEIPDVGAIGSPPGNAALRRWLRRYNAAQSGEAAMIRVWVDAALQDATLRVDSAAAFDWGWRRLAPFLAPRGFGDVDSEAVVMVALLSAFGGQKRSATEVEATAHIIESGLLGR